MSQTMRRTCGLFVVALLVAAVSACDSASTGAPERDGGGDGAVEGGAIEGGGVDGGGDGAVEGGPKPGDGATDVPVVDASRPDTCLPTLVDCNKRCGKITDNCGNEHACGGCDEGLVCNLDTNQCGDPLITCEDLMAECGTIRNSCGTHIACGTCPAGQECDPDTNTCVACVAVTCADLGRQCGQSWLGCGPASNLTDCGGCPDGQVCNGPFHVCEPVCTADTAENICAQAKSAKGVECGSISDGCGGVISCGSCPDGEACGVQGIANRCSKKEPPLECAVLGRNCGTLTSVCGGTVDCGSCPEGEVCNPNGVCGPPCTPKACDKEYSGQCGTQLDDGCLGTIDCDCSGDLSCESTTPGTVGLCKALPTCADYGATGNSGEPCSNEPSPTFPKDGNSSLSCPCKGAAVCVDAQQAVVSGGDTGSCCENTASCSAAAGACKVTDTCTGEDIDCCKSDEYCAPATSKCKAFATCSSVGADGEVGDPCSNGGWFDRGDGELVTCQCDPGNVCVKSGAEVSGGTSGKCCKQNVCDPASDVCSVDDGCITGAKINCCGSDEYCIDGKCSQALTCGDVTGCSNGPAFDRGDGTKLTCPCAGSQQCISGGAVVTGADTGVCCTPATCAGTSACTVPQGCVTGDVVDCCTSNEYCDGSNTCQPFKTCADFAGQCSNGGAFDRGDGTMISCPCGGGQVCTDGGAEVSGSQTGTCCTLDTCDGTTACTIPNNCVTGEEIQCCGGGQYCDGGTCRDFKTCADFAGQCSNGGAFDRGDGTMISCPCSGGQVCVDSVPGAEVSGSDIGTCCTVGSCGGTSACNVPNGCIAGAPNIECCLANEYCSTGNTCEVKKTCKDYTARTLGDDCSDMESSAFPVGDGNDLTCPCKTSGNFQDIQCNGDSASTAGTCECTPRTCGGDCTKDNQTNGCGSLLDCACTGGQVCDPNTKSCCTPKTCAGDYPGECGTKDDGCGGNIDCNCGGGDVCHNNSCCTPKTCSDYPGKCDKQDNGCGGQTANCGCPSGQVCTSSDTCCTPKTCADYPGKCGTQATGCGGALNCGCTSPQVCDPTNDTCCTKDTCGEGEGDACGSITNGCGGTMSCGCSDQPWLSCGAVQAGECGCAPATCGMQPGDACGSGLDNGCGATITCGCTGTDVCYQSKCCHPLTYAEACQGGASGLTSDGCGGNHNCAG